MLERDGEDMGRGLRTDVMKRKRVVGPLDHPGRYFTGDDPAEQAIAHPNLLGR
jgi:hypothetical protein